MHRFTTRLIILLLSASELTSAWSQTNPTPMAWNEFHGPDGSGVLADSRAPEAIGPQTLAWRTDIPPGHSSPVLSGSRVFLTAVRDDRLLTLALQRETGQIAWEALAPGSATERVHETSSPAASTPCVDDQRVYVYFGSFGLLCYDHDGQELWRYPIPTPQSLYGMSTSPILYRDQVILVVDNDANLPGSDLSASKIIAVHREHGTLSWQIDRPLQRSSWSTPTIWHLPEGDQLIVLGSRRLCAYDLETRDEVWSVSGFSRETVARPVVDAEQVYASAAMIGGVGDEQPDPEPFWKAILRFDANRDQRLQPDEMTEHFTFPLRPDLPIDHPGFGIPQPRDPQQRRRRLASLFERIDSNRDGVWTRDEFLNHLSFNRGKPNLVAVKRDGRGELQDSQIAWKLHRNIPEVPSPVLVDGQLVLLRDGGILTLVDARTGDVLHRQRLEAAGHFQASPVVAGNRLYAISQAGVLTVVRLEADLPVVQQYDFGESVAATPALDEDTLYVRTESALYAFRTSTLER